MEVTLSRGSTSVDIPVVDDQSGSPLIVRTFGEPNGEPRKTGTINPFPPADFWSKTLQYNILGRFYGSNAYSDAITLLDLLKSKPDGAELTLDVPLSDFDSSIPVAPAAGQQEAASIAYNPGRRNMVEVDLGLTRVTGVQTTGQQDATTPTASGSGPIQLSYNGATVDLSTDVVVERAVGRPQDTVRRNSNALYPNYYAKHKTAFDQFELSFEFVENAVQKANDIVNMVATKRGRETLTLSFNGLYGMGDINVVPPGSDAMRLNRVSGEQGTNLVPSLSLRRVLSIG